MSVTRSLVFATDALEPLAGLTARAEAAGLRRVWTTELPGRDALTRAAYLALRSSTIGVGTGIAYAFGRSPQALAAAAADTQILAGGRFVLGLGTGTRSLRARWGVDFEPPATRLAEVVGAVRAAWDADALASPPPVAGAGLSAAMLRTAGQVCDRVLLAPLCLLRAHLDDRALPAVAAGAARRADAGPAISAWCIASVDPDGDAARARASGLIAFYLTRSDYAAVLGGTPWAPLAARLRAAIAPGAAPDWTALGALVPGELADELAVAGTPAQAAAGAARLERELATRGVGELVFQVPGLGLGAAAYDSAAGRVIAALGPRGGQSEPGD